LRAEKVGVVRLGVGGWIVEVIGGSGGDGAREKVKIRTTEQMGREADH